MLLHSTRFIDVCASLQTHVAGFGSSSPKWQTFLDFLQAYFQRNSISQTSFDFSARLSQNVFGVISRECLKLLRHCALLTAGTQLCQIRRKNIGIASLAVWDHFFDLCVWPLGSPGQGLLGHPARSLAVYSTQEEGVG